MATSFKTFLNGDKVSTRTLLHESIPITGSIISGTYYEKATKDSETNIKNYSHGLFQSVYDYPYLSSSANHIFDLTMGYSVDSPLYQSIEGTYGTDAPNKHSVQQQDKVNMYNQMAQLLAGYDKDGNIRRFDQDGDLASGGTKMREVFFINFARLLGKDELKKGSFQISFITGGLPSAFGASGEYTITPGGNILTLGDYSATSSYYTNSPAGEYGILYSGSATPNARSGWGLLFYQAGVAVITGAVWTNAHGNGPTNALLASGAPNNAFATAMGAGVHSSSWGSLLTGSGGTVEFISDSIRNRIQNISFNNTVELNSTIYFCRAHHNEFNYSSNPTYLSSSQIRVKSTTSDNPVTYITTVGLYSSDNELLAVAKLSEPLKKDPNTELTLRVRLDY